MVVGSATDGKKDGKKVARATSPCADILQMMESLWSRLQPRQSHKTHKTTVKWGEDDVLHYILQNIQGYKKEQLQSPRSSRQKILEMKGVEFAEGAVDDAVSLLQQVTSLQWDRTACRAAAGQFAVPFQR